MVLRTDNILKSNILENWIIKITFTFTQILFLSLDQQRIKLWASNKSNEICEILCHFNWSISCSPSHHIRLDCQSSDKIWYCVTNIIITKLFKNYVTYIVLTLQVLREINSNIIWPKSMPYVFSIIIKLVSLDL